MLINCGKVSPLWVKKLIKTKEWESGIYRNSSYSFLNNEKGKGVWVGFMVADEGVLPMGCEKVSDEELRLIDLDRRATKTYPLPFNAKENV